ncbi:MAG: hypothetical protein WCS18_11620 [Sphaerochaetaceae bacterium]
MSENKQSEVTAGTPSPERLGSAVDDALSCDPSLFISCIPTPPFDRARIARNWKAMVDEIKRLRSEVNRLQNTKGEARGARQGENHE